MDHSGTAFSDYFRDDVITLAKDSQDVYKDATLWLSFDIETGVNLQVIDRMGPQVINSTWIPSDMPVEDFLEKALAPYTKPLQKPLGWAEKVNAYRAAAGGALSFTIDLDAKTSTQSGYAYDPFDDCYYPADTEATDDYDASICDQCGARMDNVITFAYFPGFLADTSGLRVFRDASMVLQQGDGCQGREVIAGAPDNVRDRIVEALQVYRNMDYSDTTDLDRAISAASVLP